ncbi:hypothetical protein HDE_00195 [Halotydeus destructor]|nr:hypothetical protein HDE_00195 [Halotydeus destructor]
MSERGNENNCQSSLLTFVKTQVKQNIEHVKKLSTLIEAINVVQSTSKPVKEVHSEGNKILKSVLAFLKSLEMKAESEATARSSPVILEDLKTCMKDIIAEKIGKLQLAQPTPSYAAVTQTRAETSHRNASVSVPKHIVRVRTKNKDWSTRELRDTLKENIELTEQVRIEQMRCGSDAVTIARDSFPAKEALITAIRSKADSLLLEVEDKQLLRLTTPNRIPAPFVIRVDPKLLISSLTQSTTSLANAMTDTNPNEAANRVTAIIADSVRGCSISIRTPKLWMDKDLEEARLKARRIEHKIGNTRNSAKLLRLNSKPTIDRQELKQLLSEKNTEKWNKKLEGLTLTNPWRIYKMLSKTKKGYVRNIVGPNGET